MTGDGASGAGVPETSEPTFRRGVRLGIDVGTVRVGVASCDPDGLVATPVATLKRAADGSDIDALVEMVRERGVVAVYVGLPRHLSGREGDSAVMARAYARTLEERIAPLPVRLVDERLSTVTAQQALRSAGRDSRRQREVIDQAAAVIILESALDAEKRSGTASW